MLRRTLLILSVTSLLISLGIAVLGLVTLRGYYFCHTHTDADGRDWHLVAEPPILHFKSDHFYSVPRGSDADVSIPRTRIRLLQFHVERTDRYFMDSFAAAAGSADPTLPPNAQRFRASVPIYYLVILFALPALVYLPFHGLLKQRHRRRHHLCPTCAYDLRASKDRCPECGAPITSPASPPAATPGAARGACPG